MNAKYNAPSWWPKKAAATPPKPIEGIQIKILGCGPSSGTPLLVCNCKTCKSKKKENTRTRASIYVQMFDKTILVDTSPDLRHQAITHKLSWIDAVLFTHAHADHVHGIDELRSFNYVMAKSIPCYADKNTVQELNDKFSYIFKLRTEESSVEGGGIPLLDLKEMPKTLNLSKKIKIQSIPVIHGKLPVLGFRFGNAAYITDCTEVPTSSLKLLKGLDVLILDCLRPKFHSTHLHVEKALDLANKIGAKLTYFTHMGHELEYFEFARSLPKNIFPAYDGLTIKVSK